MGRIATRERARRQSHASGAARLETIRSPLRVAPCRRRSSIARIRTRFGETGSAAREWPPRQAPLARRSQRQPAQNRRGACIRRGGRGATNCRAPDPQDFDAMPRYRRSTLDPVSDTTRAASQDFRDLDIVSPMYLLSDRMPVSRGLAGSVPNAIEYGRAALLGHFGGKLLGVPSASVRCGRYRMPLSSIWAGLLVGIRLDWHLALRTRQ